MQSWWAQISNLKIRKNGSYLYTTKTIGEMINIKIIADLY